MLCKLCLFWLDGVFFLFSFFKGGDASNYVLLQGSRHTHNTTEYHYISEISLSSNKTVNAKVSSINSVGSSSAFRSYGLHPGQIFLMITSNHQLIYNYKIFDNYFENVYKKKTNSNWLQYIHK